MDHRASSQANSTDYILTYLLRAHEKLSGGDAASDLSGFQSLPVRQIYMTKLNCYHYPYSFKNGGRCE
jgi:hypothetical protein